MTSETVLRRCTQPTEAVPASRSRIFGRAQGGIRSLACRPLGHAPAAQPVSAGDATTGVAATATGGTVVVVVVVVLA